MKTQKKTYTIKLSRPLSGFPKEKANRKMILHILKMAIIISSNYLIIHTHYKPISRKKSFYQKIKKNQFQEMIIVVFFQFGNLQLNNLPKNDVWELEKYLKRKKWMVQMVKNLPNLSWICSTNGPIMKIFIIKVPMLEGKKYIRNFLRK